MLVRFVASNFLSLKEEVEFSMLTGDFESHKHHVYQAGEIKVLKAAAIYGANGAGKSNLVKAIGFLQELVKEGAVTTSVNSKKFKLDPVCQEKPIQLEIEFFADEKLYSYGIAIDDTAVLEEWLYELKATKEDMLIFERMTDEAKNPTITFAAEYQKTEKQKLLKELMEENLLKENQLLLGKNQELKIGEILAARKWIVFMLDIIYPDSLLSTEAFLHTLVDGKYPNIFVHDFLSTFDTGITKVKSKKMLIDNLSEISESAKKEISKKLDSRPSVVHKVGNELIEFIREGEKDVALKVVTFHKANKKPIVEFDLSEESNGTRRIFDYLLPILSCVAGNQTILIDEIDQSIHPSLLKDLLQKVMADENTKGQLIFTTHESNLLNFDIFRQDEIWFAEKERETGATHFYSLSEFKPDYGSDIEKGYLNGRFGAIPFLGNLENLNWHPHAEKE